MKPTVAPGSALPWWLEEAPPDPPAPVLEGEIEADVAIVGAGYTGLWTALELRGRDPSLRVVLVEADRSGLGPSGRNGGFLHGYWANLARLRERLGDEGALATARAAEGVVAAVRGLGEDVWLREAGMLKISAAPAQDVVVEEAVEAARKLGVPEEAVALSAEEVAERCRSPVFRRGVFFREGGTVQPARLARALRRAALAAGATLFEHSQVKKVAAGVVETDKGRVRAQEIVVATNAWAAAWTPARSRLTVFGSYVEATAARAEAGLRRLLPALGRARVTHSWGGPIDVSADQLPLFKTVPGTRIHYGAGYSGNGVGPSWLGGRILASLALGSEDELTELPIAHRSVRPLPPEPLRRLGGGLVRASILACERSEEEGRRPALVARAGRALPRALGIRIGTR